MTHRFNRGRGIQSSIDKLRLFGTIDKFRTRYFGGGDEKKSESTQTNTPQFYAQPEYAEATKARQDWSNTLNDWKSSGSYGAVLPNFDNIYTNAAKKVNQYYWGSPSAPGLSDKIGADLARRGMSDQTAAGVLKQRMGVEEANKLGDLSSQVDTQKASAVESARNNWMTSLMNLSSMKPAGTWGETTTTTQTMPQDNSGTWGALSQIGGGLFDMYNNGENQAFFGDLLKGVTTPQTTQSSITGDWGKDTGSNNWTGGGDDGSFDWLGGISKAATMALPFIV